MTITLRGAQESINRFLEEARACAAQQLGFAATLTTFPVLLSVSEALGVASGKYKERKDVRDEILFEDFVPYMPGNKSSWLVPRRTTQTYSDPEIAHILCDIRNSLVHQHSLPDQIGMANTTSEVQGFLKSVPHVVLAICVVDFVATVQLTVDQLISRSPNAAFDPFGNVPRSPAIRVTFPVEPPKS
jgi:hypothetical protein